MRVAGGGGVAVTAPVTVSLSRLSRARAVLADPAPGRPGVLTTDRHPAYDRLPSDQRQVCWAPVRRDARAMIDRRAAGAATATDGLGHADILLLQWQRVRDGTPTRRGFRPPDLGWVRPGILAPPGRGAGCGRGTTAGVCRERLAAEPASYTFAAAEGVGPTNDAAGRALRHAVWWRRTSYGTDSAGGGPVRRGC